MNLHDRFWCITTLRVHEMIHDRASGFEDLVCLLLGCSVIFSLFDLIAPISVSRYFFSHFYMIFVKPRDRVHAIGHPLSQQQFSDVQVQRECGVLQHDRLDKYRSSYKYAVCTSSIQRSPCSSLAYQRVL